MWAIFSPNPHNFFQGVKVGDFMGQPTFFVLIKQVKKTICKHLQLSFQDTSLHVSVFQFLSLPLICEQYSLVSTCFLPCFFFTPWLESLFFWLLEFAGTTCLIVYVFSLYYIFAFLCLVYYQTYNFCCSMLLYDYQIIGLQI